MAKSKPKVEMQHAWEWICDDCGRNNFVSSIVAEMPPEEKLQFAKDQGMIEDFVTEIPEELLAGDSMTFPIEVKCSHCGAEFETEHDEDDPEF